MKYTDLVFLDWKPHTLYSIMAILQYIIYILQHESLNLICLNEKRMKWVYKWCFGQYHSVRTFNDMNGYSGDDFNYEDDEYNQLLSECLYEQNFEETGNPSNQTNSPYGFFQSLFEKSEQNSYHDNDNLSSNSDSSSSSSDSGGGGGD